MEKQWKWETNMGRGATKTCYGYLGTDNQIFCIMCKIQTYLNSDQGLIIDYHWSRLTDHYSATEG